MLFIFVFPGLDAPNGSQSSLICLKVIVVVFFTSQSVGVAALTYLRILHDSNRISAELEKY